MDKFNILEFLEQREPLARQRDSLIQVNDTGIWDDEIQRLQDCIADIDRVIFGVQTPEWRNLLVMKYINGYTVDELIDMLFYSRSSIKRKLRKARAAAEAVYKDFYF